MSYFLGISSLDSDATITVIKDGKICYAAQEERFTRKKQQDGFPYHAIQSALAYLNITIDDLESISYGWFTPPEEMAMYKKSGSHVADITGWSRRPFFPTLRHRLNLYRRSNYTNFDIFKKYDAQLRKGLQDIGYKKELARYHHQDCHAASAYYTSGYDKCLIFTMDGYGSGSCGGVFLGENNRVKPIEYIESPQSLGLMYARVTKALGFIPNRHEGKVLGLAAYGNPDTCFAQIMEDFDLTPGSYHYHNTLDPWKYRRLFETASQEDLAAGFQKVLETVVVHWVSDQVRQHGISKVCLAGGVAANVKMNQRVMEIPEVSEVYIHPGMSDCGIGTGAAFLDAASRGTIKPYVLSDVYLGPDYQEADIKKALDQFDFKYERKEDVEGAAAELLAQGHVVGRFNGRMEYGPRALCNRTIYAPTQDNGINKWLNTRLNRTEFMPFAPVTLDYMADKMYKNLEKARYTSKFMTITTDCTEDMRRLSPAAVHVDGTARPQIVNALENPSAFKVLDAYYKLTGVPNLVNTSYNMHEEPIICTPYDALKAFKDGRLDYLALGDYLVHGQ